MSAIHRLLIGVCLLLGLSASGNAQEMAQSTIDDFNYGEFRPNNLAPRYGVAEKPGQLLGQIYIDSTFRSSSVVFYKEVIKRYDPNASDSIAGYYLRINLLEELVEFKIGDALKGVDDKALRRLYVTQPDGSLVKYVNTRDLGPISTEIPGFVEVLAEGALNVYRYQDLKIKEPTYSVALSVGDKNAYYYLRPSYYYQKGNKPAQEFKLNKKGLLELMSDRKSTIEKFMDSEKIDIKDNNDLHKLLAYYNARKAERE